MYDIYINYLSEEKTEPAIFGSSDSIETRELEKPWPCYQQKPTYTKKKN